MNKFNAKKIKVDGMVFDSKREYRRYEELHDLMESDKLTFLDRQVEFKLLPKQKGERAVNYFADFVYIEKESKTLVIEDVKSKITKKKPDYIIKRKLVKFIYINEPEIRSLKMLFPNRDFDKAEFREVE